MIKTPHVIAWIALATTLAAGAQELRYRSNDPFVFCRYGYKENVLEACWVPAPPYTGAFTLTGVCDPPNEDGRPWNNEDHDAQNQYLAICPQAVTSGEWKGPGDGTETPFKH
ncbi:MAG: hypothetical protein JSS14_10765 [Proteobacteria bacterium]|nr:hypothetical protein [Pseudomonadota bacterium]